MCVRDLYTRGIAGVGAPKAAVGARSSSTSSSSPSSLSPSEICDILPATFSKDEATDGRFLRTRRARGEGEPREELPGEGLGLPNLEMSRPERALLPLMSEPFGVDGVWRVNEDDDAEESGRALEVAPVLTIFVGRVEEDLWLEGVTTLDFVGVEGVTLKELELVRFVLRAALWGRGLMGRDVFSEGGTAERGLVCSFFSSSEELSRRRVPALTGEDGFADSMADLGRYLGNADVAFTFLGRSLADIAACGVVGSDGLTNCSSGDDL